jgi:ABC-type sugar transport system ATPase subunit
LIKILSGVYQPDHGQLLVDGKPVRFGTPRDALDAGIATVFQDLAMVPLMAIWRNFFLGSEPTKGRGPLKRFDATTAKRITRKEMADMGIDIRDPDQPVGTLSGGERQSVAIARAVHFGARLLILDEPTSALDAQTEALLLEALELLMAGRTTFIIAHRLSTIRRADRIVVVESGQVVEVGTHQQLLAARGAYCRLHELQFPPALLRDGARHAARSSK